MCGHVPSKMCLTRITPELSLRGTNPPELNPDANIRRLAAATTAKKTPPALKATSANRGMEQVASTLSSWLLGQYAEAFEEQGYDDLDYLKTLSTEKLMTLANDVAMKPGHAGKFALYMSQLAAGKPIPTASPALQALPPPKPCTPAASSTSLVPHKASSMAQMIVRALDHGNTSRDAIVEYITQHGSSLQVHPERAKIVQSLSSEKSKKHPRWTQDGDSYTLMSEDDEGGEAVVLEAHTVTDAEQAKEEEEEEEDDDDDAMEAEESEEEADEMDGTDAGRTEAALERAGKGRKEGTGADEKKAAYQRAKVLYGAEGQRNPALERAAKKKAKKIKNAVARAELAGGDDSGSDFEWEDDA